MRSSMLAMLALAPLCHLIFPSAQAACSFGPDTGDDRYVCDSGTGSSLTDLNGNNSLTLPASGTGTIGDVQFGAGIDVVYIGAGTAGAIDQGDGEDRFTMTAGTIDSLDQGTGLDTFEMSGGRINGAFLSGDFGRFSGGFIGSVNMRLDDNTFIMTGGTIGTSLVTGLGTDRVELSGGSIGTNVSLSSGNDTLLWNGGGTIAGEVRMGQDDDLVRLENLTQAQLGIVQRVDGDEGNDNLLFVNTQASGGARYTGWESVALTNGSHLTLDDGLVLGDAISQTGTLTLDGSSTLSSRTGTIGAAAGGQLANVVNGGLIDLGGGNDAAGRLTISGNYIGNGGRLALNSVLGDDSSASDRLVVDQGTLTGTTSLLVSNLGGAGALTTGDGIQVVQATGGATSSAGAFSLGRPVAAGPFEYLLFKGGLGAGTQNNWYLRSTQVINGQSTVLYRPEVPLYAVANRAAALLASTTLSTFHERQGEQGLLRENGVAKAGWGRLLGGRHRQSYTGDVSPSLDARFHGFQVGHDLYGRESASGYRQHAGVYISRTRLDGDVKGFALGEQNSKAGNIRLDGDAFGAYWTLVGPQSWYLDTVVQYINLDGRARSDRGTRLDLQGQVWSGSLEFGAPFTVSDHWNLEPQAQLIAQQVSLHSDDDGISRVGQDSDTSWLSRVGARLHGRYQAWGTPLEPYLRANVWRSFGKDDTLTFDGQNPITTGQAASWYDVGAGLSAQLTAQVSVYGSLNYGNNLDSSQQEQVAGTLGVRMSW